MATVRIGTIGHKDQTKSELIESLAALESKKIDSNAHTKKLLKTMKIQSKHLQK